MTHGGGASVKHSTPFHQRAPKVLRWITVGLIVLVLCPSIAFADLNYSGRLTFNINGRLTSTPPRKLEISSISRLNLTATFYPGNDDTTRAVVDIAGATPVMYASAGDPLIAVPENLTAGSSYLETSTPLWSGGPPWLIRLGTQSLRWSSMISRVSSRTGLTVSNVMLGPVHTRWFYLWASPSQGVASGVQASSSLGPAVIDTTIVGIDSKYQAAVESSASFLDRRLNLGAGASFSAAGLGQTRLNVMFAVNRDLDISLSRQQVIGPDPFSPHPPRQATHYGLQARWTIRDYAVDWSIATIQQTGQPSPLSQRLGINRSFNIGQLPVSLGYDLDWNSTMGIQEISHSLNASTQVNLGVFRGIRISTNAGWGTDEELSWRANASYSVPRGPSLSLAYDKNSGPSFSATIGINF